MAPWNASGKTLRCAGDRTPRAACSEGFRQRKLTAQSARARLVVGVQESQRPRHDTSPAPGRAEGCWACAGRRAEARGVPGSSHVGSGRPARWQPRRAQGALGLHALTRRCCRAPGTSFRVSARMLEPDRQVALDAIRCWDAAWLLHATAHGRQVRAYHVAVGKNGWAPGERPPSR